MLKFLIEKEFKLILRNPILPRLIFIMPVVLLVILPNAANYEVRNINLVVVDNDHSSYSARLVAKSASSGYFRLVASEASYEQALERQVERGRADVALEIPQGFERDLVRQGSARVLISANTVNATKGALGSSYLASVTADVTREINLERGAEAFASQTPTIDVATRNRYNQDMDYRAFMVPALMMMLMTLLCGMMPAVSIVGEKETGTIEQINVTPVTKFKFILAKLIPFWTIGYIVLTVALFLSLLLYGLWPESSLLTLYAGATVFIVVISGMGLLVSNSSSNMQQAMFVTIFFLVIFMLMSGFFTPVTSMPEWAQWVTVFNPQRYFAEIMRMVYIKGSSIADLWRDFLALGLFAVVLNGLAIISYRKRV
ncbi:MAG: ABC transporter permease [Rikenellaceae bacterium]|jgi:ABC-2 type transport system permease protein|nr:ABC transporter permease [Rikenellaceae bacterium]